MDYRGFRAGTTVYFPVFTPGALFFLGDGHALQGAGEIVGTGIEISCDIRFQVDLQKGRRIRWPRGETTTQIFTTGNARPLDQALQQATTEMTRWLQEEYGMAPLHAQTLLGQVVDYEVGNVFDPAYTMVCMLDKRWLPR
jgi:acetamidase/formamidase